MRKAGGEYGAATGRPRRIGPFDAVASRYGLKCQNADKIALTKMDVLSSMKEIPVITGYKRDGVIVTDFDPMDELDSYTSVVEMLPGWECDNFAKEEQLLTAVTGINWGDEGNASRMEMRYFGLPDL